MFVVSCLEDDVRVAPQLQNLGLPTEEAVLQALEKTFLDKVIKDLGLVVTIYDIVDIQEGNVYHSDGDAHYRVTFNVVVFKPSVGETLIGTVTHMDKDGITLSLGFFKDIHIPADFLPKPSEWKEDAGRWDWMLEDDDGQPQTCEFMTNGKVLFEVHAVRYKALPTLAAQQQQRDAAQPVEGTKELPFVPMHVVGTAAAHSLGMVAWYEDDE